MRRAGGTTHRTRRTAAQLRKLLEQFERSGQTRGKFCAVHGLALSTFDLWRRRLGATLAPVDEEHPEAVFVELTNPTQTQTSPTSSGTGAWKVELELGSPVPVSILCPGPPEAGANRPSAGAT